MSKDKQTLEKCLAEVRQLRMRPANRFGLHIRISGLERLYRDSSFKRLVGLSLQPLVRSHASKTFPLTSGDMLVVTGPVTEAVVEKCLRDVRDCFKGCDTVDRLKPKPGVSDSFITWFHMPVDLDGFETMVTTLLDLASADDEAATAPPQSGDIPFAKVKPGVVPQAPETPTDPAVPQSPAPQSAAPKKVVRLPGDEDEASAEPKDVLDVDRFASLVKQLVGADLDGHLERIEVMAVTPAAPPTPVMVHREVPFERVAKAVLGHSHFALDPWLQGYLEDLIATTVLASHPDVGDKGSMASSLRATCSAVQSPVFEQFDRSLGERPRKRVIIELSMFEAFVDPGRFMAALARVKERGFRTQVAGVDARAFTWLTSGAFDVNFIKLKASQAAYEEWLNPQSEGAKAFRSAVKAFGPERVVLDGCTKPGFVTAGQKLGIYLFAGSAVGKI